MNGPTIVPCRVMHRLDRRRLVVDPLHDLELLADDVVGVLVPVGLGR